LLFLTATLFICSALGQGILISTITRSQQVAYQVAAFSSLLPALLLSDFVFPIRNMPVVIQAITYFVPARYFVFILRSILLKGVGIESFIMELCALAVFSILMLGIASIRMNRARLI
jgi:ABC-2 type transport system permease protein